jgi:hypothetical protein
MEWDELYSWFKAVEKKYNEIEKEYDLVFEQIKVHCPHPQTEIKKYYSESGYLDPATTTTQEVCVVCHKVLKQSIKTHGFS